MRLATALSAAIAFIVATPFARADISVDFGCSIPAAGGFDCNVLKQRFFKENALPFVKVPEEAKPSSPALKVSVSRAPVLNGYAYSLVIAEQGKGSGEGSMLRRTVFIPDTLNSTSAQAQINGFLQQGVLYFAKSDGEATVSNGLATVVYQDPAGTPSNPGSNSAVPKNDGRWILTPATNLYMQQYSNTPMALAANANGTFNYSGDRARYQASVSGSYSRASTPVANGNNVQVVNYQYAAASASASASVGLDRQNHINVGTSVSAQTSPITNINTNLRASVGVEYNQHPFLSASDPETLTVGCAIAPGYYDLAFANLFNKRQFGVLAESCAVMGTLLIDSKRGSTISGTIGENWYPSEPSVISANVALSLNWRLTDRIAITPTVAFNLQSKSIATVGPGALPSLEGLSPSQVAYEEAQYSNQANESSTYSYSATIGFSYTFGEGVNRNAQDQRGTENH